MSIYYQDDTAALHHGDAATVLAEIPDGSVDCVVTSPPYFGLRDYGVEGQIGAEASPADFVGALVEVFREARRVLASDGTLWLNLGDSYSSGSRTTYADTGKASRRISAARPPSDLPGKNLLGIPWQVAFALQDDGWILRNDIIWSKPNAMPESVADRLSSRHEHLFMLTKSRRYYFDLNPIREVATTGAGGNGRNPGDVWAIPTQPFAEAHFATMPPALAERCVMAGCKPGGTVLDPFSGSGTTGHVAAKHGLRYIGIDLNAEYLDLSLRTRLAQPAFAFGGIA